MSRSAPDPVGDVERLREKYDPGSAPFADYDGNLYDLRDALTGLRFGDGVEYAPVVFHDDAEALADWVETVAVTAAANRTRIRQPVEPVPGRPDLPHVGYFPRALVRRDTRYSGPVRIEAADVGIPPDRFVAVLDDVRVLLSRVEADALRTHCLICGHPLPWWGLPNVTRLLWPTEWRDAPYHLGCVIDQERPE